MVSESQGDVDELNHSRLVETSTAYMVSTIDRVPRSTHSTALLV